MNCIRSEDPHELKALSRSRLPVVYRPLLHDFLPCDVCGFLAVKKDLKDETLLGFS